MPITKARRNRARKAAEQVEAGASMLQYKLMGPLTLAKLEDISGHFQMLKAIIEAGEGAIREAIWKTNTTPTRAERKRDPDAYHHG